MAVSIQPIGNRVYHFRSPFDNELVARLRRNSAERMTVVEQLMKIREEVCIYACKYREKAKQQYPNDDIMQKLFIQGYCHVCPLAKVHYNGRRI